MTPTANGRHCAACQKTVVDFTWKTDAEILAYLASASGETCGRLRSDQQNRALVAAPAAASPAPRWRAWLATALALWGTRESAGLGAAAHAAPAPSAHHSPGKAQRHRPAAKLLQGVVRNAATHEPLAGVAVFLKGENRSATTDSSGHFSLRLPAGRPSARRRLVLHRAGYLSRQLPLAAAPSTVQLALHPDPAAAGVEVVAVQWKREERMISGAVTWPVVAAEQAPVPPATPPATVPTHGFFYWLTRPFRRS
jgi:hypothetical protein